MKVSLLILIFSSTISGYASILNCKSKILSNNTYAQLEVSNIVATSEFSKDGALADVILTSKQGNKLTYTSKIHDRYEFYYYFEQQKNESIKLSNGLVFSINGPNGSLSNGDKFRCSFN
jgi:hypothetical protein